MTIARMMMLAGEVLAVLGLLGAGVLPSAWGISFRVSPQFGVVLPMRWCVPALLLATGGFIALASVAKAYWELARH